MPKLAFSQENKIETPATYPRLKFELGERKRILCIEEPVFAYVHTLRAPKIIDGKPVMKTEKRSDETTYETYDRDFLGRPQCLGDITVLQQVGLDPKNCPICEYAQESDAVAGPDRRFAMHVINYAVQPNSFNIQLPFSVSLVVWSFTETTFNKIVDIANEAKDEGGLMKHDLLLGPCSNKTWQKLESIGMSLKAAWLESEATKNLTVSTYKENQLKGDLEEVCGPKRERRWLEEDLEKIQARWRIINSGGVAAVTQNTLAAGFDELLGSSNRTSTETPTTESDPVSIEDILASSTTAEEPKSESSDTVVNLFSDDTATSDDSKMEAVTVKESKPETATEKAQEPLSLDELMESFDLK